MVGTECLAGGQGLAVGTECLAEGGQGLVVGTECLAVTEAVGTQGLAVGEVSRRRAGTSISSFEK